MLCTYIIYGVILFIWFCENELEYNNDSVNASRHVGHDRQLKHLPIIEMSETGHQARLQVPTMPDCAPLGSTVLYPSVPNQRK